MKLNNKGFAITAVLYGLLILFVILVGSYLTVLSVRKSRTDNLLNDMEEDYLENASSNQEENNNPGNETRTIYTVTLDSGFISNDSIYFVSEENKWYSDERATTEIHFVSIPSGIIYSNSTFNGYYTRTAGAGTQIIDSTGVIVSNSITEDTTLYAYWTINGGGGGGDATI